MLLEIYTRKLSAVAETEQPRTVADKTYDFSPWQVAMCEVQIILITLDVYDTSSLAEDTVILYSKN